ncbi:MULTISPECIES: carbohydrate porin [unclassified Gilliamella]|uniref:carbohydrate porin n=1 Tax=unclassified Gilliamella TaxID=2685620 RepID=UPI00226ABEF4|nr:MULTISPECIES: carbohydrate porin [unclassified Gilliamella]MCX8641869.1 carbohydrate porin [Gilliamella sp. B3835]MCX8706669.1 carbohydrate porin [Gilliamella sp. B3783]MCX8708862.1 carbohydrate porin [Gilliamella sp. B3780]MCX8713146.1 carbohydrate porin [Gilliamella sp. B3468]MCX8713646.1 carbohydrate porin [Gilliamella sp. B3781]
MKKFFVLSLLGLSSIANAAIQWDTQQGQLKLYGDVEFNTDAASSKQQLSSLKQTADKKNQPADKDRWDINGRILIGLDGYREINHSNYAGFTVQPLADLSGDMNLDDAAFYFGQKKEWNIKIGRYEAYDMFPLGQDTFIEYSGNTANDLYEDGFGYIYMMKEGRGRSKNGGSIQLNKPFLTNFNFELNGLINNGEKMFNKSTYHGYNIDKKKNVAYVRPVLSWKNDSISTAIAAETNVVKNAYGYYDNDEKFRDQSKRTGYGATFSWNSEGDWNASNKGLKINTSFAYMNAKDEKDMTIGTNLVWEQIGFGYIFANNDIKKFNLENRIKDGHINNKGKYKIHTVNASYLINNVLDMDNFNIYLGTYYSLLDRSKSHGDNTDDRYGARVRFKYFY